MRPDAATGPQEDAEVALAQALNATVGTHGWLRSAPADPVEEWMVNAGRVIEALAAVGYVVTPAPGSTGPLPFSEARARARRYEEGTSLPEDTGAVAATDRLLLLMELDRLAAPGSTGPLLYVAGDPESLARLFHETYERLAPEHGYETRKDSAVPWDQVPEANRSLMVAVAREVWKSIQPAPGSTEPRAGRPVRAPRNDATGPERPKRAGSGTNIQRLRPRPVAPVLAASEGSLASSAARLAELIAVGLLAEPNGLDLTANEAHAVAGRIAGRLVAR